MEQATPITNSAPVNQYESLDFLSLAKETFNVYGQKWKSLLLAELAYFGIGFITAIIVVATLIGLIAALAVIKNVLAIIAIAAIVAILLFIFTMYLSSWISSAIIVILRDRRENIGLPEAFRRAKPYIISYLWVNVVTGLIIFFGLVFFVIPGIIFSIWLSFSRYVVITDKERGLGALIKSRQYTRGLFWKIFWLSMLGAIPIFIFDSAIEPLNNGVGKIIYFAGAYLVSPLWTIFFYLIFDRVRKIKGDIVPAHSPVQKNFFASLAGLGLAIVIAIAGLVIYLAPRIENFYKNELPKYQPQNNQPPQAPLQNSI